MQKVELFKSKKDLFYFFILLSIIFFISISLTYKNYKEFTKFNSKVVQATVINQYKKTKEKNGKIKTYQVLKLKTKDGINFYTISYKKLKNIKNQDIQLKIYTNKITFIDYLKGFFTFSKILKIYENKNLKISLISYIDTQHKDKNISKIYQAMFLATSLPKNIQEKISILGISHLIAISGFHLGIIGALLFFLLKYPYKFLQNRYFPYRSYSRDSFFIISIILFFYMQFLNYPPSLVRAFFMLIIGYILYDRGIKIISIQTLFITLFLLLALNPSLFFSIGFWLSIFGVFYIFLFFIHFKELPKIWQFLLLPFFVYMMMLPYSIFLFKNFSNYHYLSILWSTIFNFFYPIEIFLHIIKFGDLLDVWIEKLFYMEVNIKYIELNIYYILFEIFLSLVAIYKKSFIYILLIYITILLMLIPS